MTHAKRTMKIHLGIGSGEENDFRGVLYSADGLVNFNDKNYTHYDDAHP